MPTLDMYEYLYNGFQKCEKVLNLSNPYKTKIFNIMDTSI